MGEANQGLALEAHTAQRRLPAEDLEGHEIADFEVAGASNGPHAALTGDLEDLIPPTPGSMPRGADRLADGHRLVVFVDPHASST